jgi:serine/threonine protein kinase
VQEWVPGGSLQQLVRQYGPGDGAVLRKYLRDILEGLKFLHDHDTIHRDLKPANVLISDRGVAKIGDFGASRKVGPDGLGEKTQTGTKGSPYYMAPEEMAADDAGGKAADVWSMGGVVLFMVTGDHPWQVLGPRSVLALFAAVSEP